MPGVRIRPLPDRQVPDNSLIVLRDMAKPLPPDKRGARLEDIVSVCSKCGVQHFHQTWHLQLRAGTVIVSPKVWANMQLMHENGGFEFVNEVPDPPAQTMQPGRETELVEKFITDISPALAGKGGK